MNSRQKAYYLIRPTPCKLILLVALLAMVAVLYSTTGGVGLSPDSAIYVESARNLVAGRGLSVLSASDEATPLTHYPCLFPVLLAAPGFLGLDPLDAARWLNAFLIGANIFLIGMILGICSDKSTWITLLGSLLILASETMLTIHSFAWTEPLLIFLGLLNMLPLGAYLRKPHLLLLIASSMAAASGFLARYVGVALVISSVIAILLLGKRQLRRRVMDIAIFTFVSCFPMALWLVRNVYVAGTATNRKMAFHPVTAGNIQRGIIIPKNWTTC